MPMQTDRVVKSRIELAVFWQSFRHFSPAPLLSHARRSDGLDFGLACKWNNRNPGIDLCGSRSVSKDGNTTPVVRISPTHGSHHFPRRHGRLLRVGRAAGSSRQTGAERRSTAFAAGWWLNSGRGFPRDRRKLDRSQQLGDTLQHWILESHG